MPKSVQYGLYRFHKSNLWDPNFFDFFFFHIILNFQRSILQVICVAVHNKYVETILGIIGGFG